MSAGCPSPTVYGPGENCGATVLPSYTPGLAETGFHLAWFLVVVLGILLAGVFLLWMIARTERQLAEARLAEALVDNAALAAENSRQGAIIELVDGVLASKDYVHYGPLGGAL